uniref:Uncharacterized protein n=1 Tax=Anguilla anguilla TaxID=7936 RepID=A0A0E9Q7X8_ANGAN
MYLFDTAFVWHFHRPLLGEHVTLPPVVLECYHSLNYTQALERILTL